MLGDSRGQISAELVLLIGLFLILILGVTTYFGQSNEVNVAMSAAREGVINASNDIAYTGSGNVVRFNNMNFNNGTITVNVASEFPMSSSDLSHLHDTAISSISNSLSDVTSNTSTSVTTKRYTYTVNINNNTY